MPIFQLPGLIRRWSFVLELRLEGSLKMLVCYSERSEESRPFPFTPFRVRVTGLIFSGVIIRNMILDFLEQEYGEKIATES
jgi:hypothetical protein